MMKVYETYKNVVIPSLQKDHGYKNIMSVPKIQKVVINMGLGKAISDKNIMDNAEQVLVEILGQRPVRTKAKKSIAGFKLREGMEIGLMATLRGAKMYDFLTKLIYTALPRVKDFGGISPKSFDGRGNYNLGIKEHIIFPEVNYDRVQKIFGLDVSIVTSAKTDKEAHSFLSLLGMPFRKQN
jgi:large subunit ribosomal protein L5